MHEPEAGPCEFVRQLCARRVQHIVCYGTSLTSGGCWVPQLETELSRRFPDLVRVTNSGEGGQHSRWGLQHLHERVIRKCPDVLFIEFAINDAVARFDVTVQEAQYNLTAMIAQVSHALPQSQIILQVMNPVIGRPHGHPGHRPHLNLYEAMYREVARAHHLLLIDHAPQWQRLLRRGEACFHRVVPDGLHPNAEGYKQFVTPTILKALFGGALPSR